MGLRAAALAVGMLLVNLTLGGSPAHAAPEDFVEACSNGIAVPDPEDNPALVQDCAVLLSIRDTLAGDATLDWSADVPVANWEGLLVDHWIGRVVLLQLNDRGLTGVVPPELGRLSGVRDLYLGDNRLTGEIPIELAALAELEYLELWGNQLTGEIPPEFGLLSKLEFLALGDNQLTGEIPTELGGLAELQYLELRANQLMGEIPPELGLLSKLEFLALGDNQLTGEIPPELGGLARLENLGLWGNRLTGKISPELGRLTNLEILWLFNNDLTGDIPPELGDLPNLQVLELFGNRLTGCIPAKLRATESNNLDRLNLPDCPDPAPADSGTGLAPSPPGALPIAVNVLAVVATLVALLGIAAGFRTRYRP